MGLDNPLHIAFLLVILLLVFGAKRLPEMGRSLGEGLRGFKTSIEGGSTPPGLTAPVAAAAAQSVASAPRPVSTRSPQVAYEQAETAAVWLPAESAPARQPQDSPTPRSEIVPAPVVRS